MQAPAKSKGIALPKIFTTNENVKGSDDVRTVSKNLIIEAPSDHYPIGVDWGLSP